VERGASQEMSDELLEGETAAEEVENVRLTAAERLRLDTLYREQNDAVIRMLRPRLANEDDVAEVMQESFLRLLRYRRCGPDSLKYLLFRVAMNLAVSHQRQASIRHVVSLNDVELVSNEMPVDQRLVQEEEMTQVAMAIQSLPPRCRQMYVMSRLRGFRQREIAQHCGISQRMVELHIAKAQSLIREQVGAGRAGSSGTTHRNKTIVFS
jgi:RNA polymerase sigma factor (sigma-70 family)